MLKMDQMDQILYDLLHGKCELTSMPFFKDQEMLEGRMTKGVTIVLLVMAIFTVVMNFGVLLRIYKLIKRGGDIKPPFYFIGNLAISDFLVGTYVIVMFCIDLSTRKSSSNWRNNCCGFLTAIVVTACQETICTITLIAVDKYIFICHGLTYRVKVTTKRVYYCLLLSWCYSFLIGLLPAIVLHEKDWCSCNFQLYITKGFSIILFLSAVVIPLVIIITLYAIILSLAVKVTRSRLRDRRTSSSGTTSIVQLSTSSRSNSKSSIINRTTLKENLESKVRSNSVISTKSQTSLKEKAKEVKFRNREIVKIDSLEIKEKKEKHPLYKTRISVGSESYETPETYISTSPDGDPKPKYDEDSSSATDSTDSQQPKINRKTKRIKTTRKSYDLSDASNTVLEKSGQSDVALQSYKNISSDGERDKAAVRIHKSVQINDVLVIRSESLTSSNNNNYYSSQDSEESVNSKQQRQWSRKSYYKKVVSETKDKVQFFKKCKAIKIIFMIVGLFIVTYVPFVVGSFVFKVKKTPDDDLFKALNNLLYCAVVLNSLLNPFVYAYGYKEFRIRTKRFKGLFAKERRGGRSNNS